jgi:predicted nucleic acid-binding protein
VGSRARRGLRLIPEPRLSHGSPPIPEGAPPPSDGSRVFVDTSAVLAADDALPFLICAQEGDLDVAWSAFVAAEVGRVATRECALEVAREAGAADVGLLRDRLEAVRRTIDAVVAAHELAWRVPDPDLLAAAHRFVASTPVADETDRPILGAAIASRSEFIVSRDAAMFPHGMHVHGIWCWHPDTFLTALFLRRPDVYRRVRLRYADVLREGRLLP